MENSVKNRKLGKIQNTVFMFLIFSAFFLILPFPVLILPGFQFFDKFWIFRIFHFGSSFSGPDLQFTESDMHFLIYELKKFAN